ncbi:hypothetical protein HDU97_010137 [Phlyctochytrium planicorne]|nr:hypothetical protein HDU97_010137 [Phlyctochytrium planicorne]
MKIHRLLTQPSTHLWPNPKSNIKSRKIKTHRQILVGKLPVPENIKMGFDTAKVTFVEEGVEIGAVETVGLEGGNAGLANSDTTQDILDDLKPRKDLSAVKPKRSAKTIKKRNSSLLKKKAKVSADLKPASPSDAPIGEMPDESTSLPLLTPAMQNNKPEDSPKRKQRARRATSNSTSSSSSFSSTRPSVLSKFLNPSSTARLNPTSLRRTGPPGGRLEPLWDGNVPPPSLLSFDGNVPPPSLLSFDPLMAEEATRQEAFDVKNSSPPSRQLPPIHGTEAKTEPKFEQPLKIVMANGGEREPTKPRVPPPAQMLDLSVKGSGMEMGNRVAPFTEDEIQPASPSIRTRRVAEAAESSVGNDVDSPISFENFRIGGAPSLPPHLISSGNSKEPPIPIILRLPNGTRRKLQAPSHVPLAVVIKAHLRSFSKGHTLLAQTWTKASNEEEAAEMEPGKNWSHKMTRIDEGDLTAKQIFGEKGGVVFMEKGSGAQSP